MMTLIHVSRQDSEADEESDKKADLDTRHFYPLRLERQLQHTKCPDAWL
jgi:hypothetical protein